MTTPATADNIQLDEIELIYSKVGQGSNPFIYRTNDNQWSIGFWAVRGSSRDRHAKLLHWTGGGFKNLDSLYITSNPQRFASQEEAQDQLSRLVQHIIDYKPGDDSFIIKGEGWK